MVLLSVTNYESVVGVIFMVDWCIAW